MKEFTLLSWGSHPDAGNDDCWYGEEFETRGEALAAFHASIKDSGVAYIELDGPEVHMERANPEHKPTKDDQSDWRHEMRMEAAMLHGIAGWNDF